MSKKNQKKRLCFNQQIQLLSSLYPACELEDTIFNVFEEANLYDEFTYEEKEKRKLLHTALRSIFREIYIEKQITT